MLTVQENASKREPSKWEGAQSEVGDVTIPKQKQALGAEAQCENLT